MLANDPSWAAVMATASAEKPLLADTMLVRAAKKKCACMACFLLHANSAAHFDSFEILKTGRAGPASYGKSSATAAAMRTADLAMLQGFLLVVIWPCIVGFTAAGTFFTVRYQQQINQQLNTGFGSTICLSFINIISSQAVSYTTDFEQWHPNVRTNVSYFFCLPAAAHMHSQMLSVAV